MTKRKTYYHFASINKTLGYGDGRKIRLGQNLKVKGQPVLCEHGLHASARPIDALKYAPGPILCKVELGGEIIHGNDKVVASERRVVAMADCSEVLREFARKCALDVIHLWDAPEVVEKYLKTGDEIIRAAAGDAARDAAWAAARDAAWDAARDAAWDAARDAAWDAARAAAWDASGAASGAAAWDAARAAAIEKQNRRLLAMLRKADWKVAKTS